MKEQLAQIRAAALTAFEAAGDSAALDALSPLKVLGRGYALAQTPEGAVVSSVDQAEPGGVVPFWEYRYRIPPKIMTSESDRLLMKLTEGPIIAP